MALGRTNINLPEIPVSSKKYLYKRGKEYSDLTGGWSVELSNFSKIFTSYTGTRSGTATKNEDNLEINLLSETNTYRYCSISTQNTFSVDGYKTLNVLYDVISRTTPVTGKSNMLDAFLYSKVTGNVDPTDRIVRLNLSNESGEGYAASVDISEVGVTEVALILSNMIGATQDTKYHAKIHEIWLEP